MNNFVSNCFRRCWVAPPQASSKQWTRSFVLAGTTTVSAALALAALTTTTTLGVAVVVEVDNNNNNNNNDTDAISSSFWNSIQPSRFRQTLCEAPTTSKEEFKDGPKLIFLGSGSSSGCPIGVCTMTLNDAKQRMEETVAATRGTDNNNKSSFLTPMCNVSHLASRGNPKDNKDYRNNPSLLIHHLVDPQSQRYKNIIIDVGKTFREGAMRWFPDFDIRSLDSIILTHEHMDAAAGLDDIRSFQRFTIDSVPEGRPVPPPKRLPIPIHLSVPCYEKLQGQYPFLFPHKREDIPCRGCHHDPLATGPNLGTDTDSDSDPPSATPVVLRDVAGFVVNLFEAYRPMTVEGLDIIPLPVWHGDDLISYGFAVSIPTSVPGKSINLVYLSDISRMVPETMTYIQQRLPPTDILVVDALLWHKQHPTHFSLDQAVELRNQLRPTIQTYLVGMSCDNYLPHDEMQAYLQRTYGDITMAHDGLAINLDTL